MEVPSEATVKVLVAENKIPWKLVIFCKLIMNLKENETKLCNDVLYKSIVVYSVNVKFYTAKRHN